MQITRHHSHSLANRERSGQEKQTDGRIDPVRNVGQAFRLPPTIAGQFKTGWKPILIHGYLPKMLSSGLRIVAGAGNAPEVSHQLRNWSP